MKNITKVAVCAALLSLTVTAANALDMSAVKGVAGNVSAATKTSVAANSNANNKAVMQNQIKAMINKSNQINKTFESAVSSASSVLLSKDQIAALKAKKAELLKKAKTGEEAAVQAKIIQEASKQLTQNAQDSEIAKQVKSLSAEKKQQLANCGYNMLLASTQYLELATQATELVSSIASDPVTAAGMGSDLKTLKKVASNLPKQGKAAGEVATSLVKVLKAGGITIPKATSTSKAKVVSGASLF